MRNMVVSARDIREVVDHIARAFKPRKIILFGSYAYGAPGGDSDVDLMVVMTYSGPAHRKATAIRLSMSSRFPMDLLVRSPAELKRGVTQDDWFIVEVLEKGIVLYDGTDRTVGAKGRSRLRRRLAPAMITQAELV